MVIVPTLLAIVPHPDDEAYAFAGTIAVAARAGWRCLVHCASNGERGERHDGAEASPATLGAARARELAASCRALGAEEPVMWGLPDGQLQEQPGGRERVLRAMSEERPSLLLALGEDGAYGHLDHLAVYRWVRDAWMLSGPQNPPLLFAAFPRGLFVPQWELCEPGGILGRPPLVAANALGASGFHYAVSVAGVREQKLKAVRAHCTQLPGGDPERLFPPGIVAALLETEWYTDARGAPDQGAAELIGSLR